jgi:hypothetical protein
MKERRVGMRAGGIRGRDLVTVCGVLGPLMLFVYFGAPLFASPLAKVLYSAKPTTAQVVAVGKRYHELLFAGVWLQATGALLSVIFFLALAELASDARSLARSVTQLGAAALVALVLAEGVFTLTWATAAANGQRASSRTSFDLMAAFIRVFPLIPAPAVYITIGILLLHAHVLPGVFARLALALGVAFAICGVIGVMAPSVTGPTAGLAGLQALWIIFAAFAWRRTTRDGTPIVESGGW